MFFLAASRESIVAFLSGRGGGCGSRGRTEFGFVSRLRRVDLTRSPTCWSRIWSSRKAAVRLAAGTAPLGWSSVAATERSWIDVIGPFPDGPVRSRGNHAFSQSLLSRFPPVHRTDLSGRQRWFCQARRTFCTANVSIYLGENFRALPKKPPKKMDQKKRGK